MNYNRRQTVPVNVGGVMIGSAYPIRIQSMTNTNTDDIAASVAQCRSLAAAGAEIVRLTAQGVREAQSIGQIRQQLRHDGCNVPLVADIHFNPKAAFAAAAQTDKVRINPGNFVDPARQFKTLTYSDEEYNRELQRIHDALVPFIDICREHHTAVRLGVNHGSLSDRIMSRYGNTAPGMVESVMEFLRVFVEQKFFDVVISMKASNVVVMVEAVRRLVAAMDAEDMHFPLHLGVTEAGFGEDGRIKSAVGIGTLLAEGLGDTIRVSLSEEPELEVPMASKLVQYIAARAGQSPIPGTISKGYDSLQPKRRASSPVAGIIGGKCAPIVVASCNPCDVVSGDTATPDFFFSPDGQYDSTHRFIVPAEAWLPEAHNTFPFFTLSTWHDDCRAAIKFLQVPANTPANELAFVKGRTDVALVVTPANVNVTGSWLSLLHALVDAGITCPAVIRNSYPDSDAEWIQTKAGTDFGTMLLNGFSDGIWIEAPYFAGKDTLVNYEFAILQAARLRMSHTEFISCPGCGRTMFDLQDTVKKVKAATLHLTHLKIGVMGCVVNGPGEMADADYGYVGAARHRISLYKGKQCIEKNIPEEDAIPRLIELIKENGDWVDPK